MVIVLFQIFMSRFIYEMGLYFFLYYLLILELRIPWWSDFNIFSYFYIFLNHLKIQSTTGPWKFSEIYAKPSGSVFFGELDKGQGLMDTI